MADTLVIAVGTFASGCVLELIRKSGDLICTSDAGGTFIRDGQDFMDVRAFDVDGTLAYRLNAPPIEPTAGWPIGTFRRCPLPGPDLIKGVVMGKYPGRFEQLNAAAVQALNGHADASGAVRNLGWLAARRNRSTFTHEIRRQFLAIIARRRRTARATERLRVILLAGTLGGFGSGAQQEFLDIIQDIAADLHIEIGLTRILLLPGMNESKDRDVTYATTHAVLTEIAAQATGAYWYRPIKMRAAHAETVRSKSVPTLLLSDTGHVGADSAEPRVTSIENFAGTVAELLRVYASPLGARLDALTADFEAVALELTSAGEPRCGTSIGISQIVLDPIRLEAFANATLTDATLSASIAPVEADVIQRDVRSFFETRRVVEGLRTHQLSDRLLERDDD